MKEFKNLTEEEKTKYTDELNADIEAAGGTNKVGTEGGLNVDKDQTNSRGFDVDKVYEVDHVGMTVVTDSKTAYAAIFFKNGQNVSIRNFIRYSVVGYKFEGDFEQTTKPEDKSPKTITANVSKKYTEDEATLYMTDYTNANMLYLAYKHGEVKLPERLRFLGKACRPWVAKKDSKSSFDHYKEGAKRVSTLNLWTEE